MYYDFKIRPLLQDQSAAMIYMYDVYPENRTPWNILVKVTGDHGEAYERIAEAYSRIRLALPKVNLASVTALDSLVPQGRYKALRAGANVYMPNLTPPDFRRRYRLYEKKSAADAFSDWPRVLEEEMKQFDRRPLWNEIGTSPMMDEPGGGIKRPEISPVMTASER